jgi:PHP family Zn ribbon phosphoesterase
MRIVADLHIHSRYSRATSSRLNPAYLERWARIKGIGLVGTGDCTHPRWLAELRENLDDAEPGLYSLKKNVRAGFDSGPGRVEELPQPWKAGASGAMPHFALSGEISTIYKRDGKTRKVHHLVILPDFRVAAAFQTRLERIGNISSDGRPILGLDSRDLLAMLLETDERSLLIPAHIWTPWFSVLGAKSGFDNLEECYRDLASFIPAVETGLSSDPPMNWALSSLDPYSIISNSDAHSPDKLGREATILDMELSYSGLRSAIRPASQTEAPGILATVEFFPEEGKYHYEGHRKCGICLSPDESARSSPQPSAQSACGEKICPVCGKPLTGGVMGRVMELADRPFDKTAQSHEANRRPFHSLIPLKEILGELLGTGPG